MSKSVYNTSRKGAVKEFEKTIAQVHELAEKLQCAICDAEMNLDDIERGDKRKQVAKSLEDVFARLSDIGDQCKDVAEDFGICIDNFVDVKRG